MLAADVMRRENLFYIFPRLSLLPKIWLKNIMEVIFEILVRRFNVTAKLKVLGSTLELPDSHFSPIEKRWL